MHFVCNIRIPQYKYTRNSFSHHHDQAHFIQNVVVHSLSFVVYRQKTGKRKYPAKLNCCCPTFSSLGVLLHEWARTTTWKNFRVVLWLSADICHQDTFFFFIQYRDNTNYKWARDFMIKLKEPISLVSYFLDYWLCA